MPLPPALLARLRKRGIIETDTQEEIIAESYDDESAAAPTTVSDQSSALNVKSASYAQGCPNKNNPYHQCVEFCHVHWGDGVVPESRRDQVYERRRQRMLRKYPLPSTDWREVYDPGFGRYYYWNMDTDEVCWLSPTHPKARIGIAAAKVAKAEWEKLARDRKAQEDQRRRQKQQQEERAERAMARGRRRKSVSPESGNESEHSDESVVEEDPMDPDGERGGRKKKPEKKRKVPKDLDPMDPAAYSDIPRGNWSTGLEAKGDAKTGVDTTANGPLFQQRPYPAPGAILRGQNKEPPKKKAALSKGPMIGPMDPTRRGHDSD